MSYHPFPNLGEILQGDLVDKIRKGIGSEYFLNRKCNCNYTTKVKGTCAYGGERRACCVAYKVTCRKCLSVYVVNTKKTLKKRMEQQLQDADQKVQYDKNSDNFAAHFAQNFNQKPTPPQCREIMKPEILSTINPIGSNKNGVNLHVSYS